MGGTLVLKIVNRTGYNLVPGEHKYGNMVSKFEAPIDRGNGGGLGSFYVVAPNRTAIGTVTGSTKQLRGQIQYWFNDPARGIDTRLYFDIHNNGVDSSWKTAPDATQRPDLAFVLWSGEIDRDGAYNTDNMTFTATFTAVPNPGYKGVIVPG